MNRLQKKCVIATAGIHLLLLTILIVGPAFFNPKSKEDNSQVLDVIPANLIDAAFNSGVKNAQPPTPTPVTVPQPQPVQPQQIQPTPPPPKPVERTFVQRVERIFKPEPKPDLKPVERTDSSHTPKINLQLVTRNAPQNSATRVDNSRKQSQAFNSAVRALKKDLSKGTTIDMPGNSSVAYANYASVVKSIYDRAWTLPDAVANDDEIVKVSVTIASDGTVLNAHIVTPSGDAPVDATVQRALDRVQFVAAFPEGMTEKEQTYIINFNPKAKRLE